MATQEQPDELAELSEWMRGEREYPRAAASVDPAARGRRRRRRLIGLLITALVIAALVAGAGGYVVWATNAPLPAPALDASAPQPDLPPAASLSLAIQGEAAISVEGGEDYLGPDAAGIWASSGANEPLPMASLTKLITAMVVLEAHPLADADDAGPTITFGRPAHELYDQYYVRGATIAAMPEGSSMSEHDALAMMLIPSASNYADAVSTWAFGSRWAFLEAARAWLDARGLHETTVVDPTGLDAGNLSTPTDLIALGKLAAADPVIAQITSTGSISTPDAGTLWNTNSILGHSGVTGLKTGNLGAGSFNLLYTATLDVGADEPLQVTGVELGGMSHDSVDRSVLATLDSIDRGFHSVDLVDADVQIGTVTTAWGESATVVTSEKSTIFTWSDTPITSTLTTTAPEEYRDGTAVGSITWTAGPQTETTDVEIVGSIQPPTTWWRLTHPGELG